METVRVALESIESLDRLLNKRLLPLKARALMRAPPIRNPILAIAYILSGIIFCLII